MKELNLFFLVPGKQLGGCTSFTVHLYKSFEQMGWKPTLYKITDGKLSPSAPRPFPYGIPIYSVSQERAYELAEWGPSLITYCFWSKCSTYAKALLDQGVPMVVHDPAEFHDDEIDLMKKRSIQPLVIRKSNVAGLKALGVQARYVPHPFVPTSLSMRTTKIWHALSLARIDFRKRTHVIIEANKTLDRERKSVHLYGEVNRVYEFHQLRKLFPDWKRWYHGEFPDKLGASTRMFSTANFAVDLTHITGDGGGTQYTFFEAWDAGIPLVLNRAWETGKEDEVRDGDACVMVKDAAELVNVLRRPVDSFGAIVEGGRRIVQQHSPAVVSEYLEAMHAS